MKQVLEATFEGNRPMVLSRLNMVSVWTVVRRLFSFIHWLEAAIDGDGKGVAKWLSLTKGEIEFYVSAVNWIIDYYTFIQRLPALMIIIL